MKGFFSALPDWILVCCLAMAMLVLQAKLREREPVDTCSKGAESADAPALRGGGMGLKPTEWCDKGMQPNRPAGLAA